MSIKDYWIQEVQNIKEFQAIAEAIDPEISDLNKKVSAMIDDQFIETATLKGVARREKILKIQPFADDTLDSRKFRIKSQWNDQLPYTYVRMLQKLNNLVGQDGYESALNYDKYTLNIKINLGQKRMINDINTIVQKMTPANIVIVVELRYNRHIDLAAYTHQKLSLRTHQELRKEILQ